jgi:hypothetical protein
MRHSRLPVAEEACVAFETVGRQVCACARCIALSTAITVGAIGCERAAGIGPVAPSSGDDGPEATEAQPVVTPLADEAPVVRPLAPEPERPTRRRAIARRSIDNTVEATIPAAPAVAARHAEVAAELEPAPDPVLESYLPGPSRSALQPALPPGRY